jgi:hypothetical protein
MYASTVSYFYEGTKYFIFTKKSPHSRVRVRYTTTTYTYMTRTCMYSTAFGGGITIAGLLYFV